MPLTSHTAVASQCDHFSERCMGSGKRDLALSSAYFTGNPVNRDLGRLRECGV